MNIHPVGVEVFQSGLKRWTNCFLRFTMVLFHAVIDLHLQSQFQALSLFSSLLFSSAYLFSLQTVQFKLQLITLGHIKQLNALLALYFLKLNLQSMRFSTASTDQDWLPVLCSRSLMSSSSAHWIQIRKQVKIAELVIIVHLSLQIARFRGHVLTASTDTQNIYIFNIMHRQNMT